MAESKRGDGRRRVREDEDVSEGECVVMGDGGVTEIERQMRERLVCEGKRGVVNEVNDLSGKAEKT